MSLTDILANLFGSGGNTGSTARRTAINVIGPRTPEKDYTNTIKTDKTKVRQLYHNVDKYYALSAQLVKPIINNNVNFIGIPKLFGNKKSLKILDELNIDYRKIHKSIEIDGDVFVWPQWDDKKGKVKLVKIPIDIVNQIFIDPITKEVTGYRLKENVDYPTIQEEHNRVELTYIVTKDVIIFKATGTINTEKKMKNPFGMIPIVHFSNDKDDYEAYGHSEIENIEPQLKFYHELTYEAGAAQSRDGHPKLKVTSNNVAQWIDNNFGAGTYEKIAGGEGTLSMEDRDLFINSEGDDVSYLYLNKTTGDYGPLSETTFTNIVEGSETPEINFGANIGTSLASVKEYRPVWIKKIEAKQYERTQPWLDTYDLILMIHNFVNIKSLDHEITMVWPKPNFASVKEQAEIIKAFSFSIEKLIATGTVTQEEVYNTLKELDIFELTETFKLHQAVIDEEVKEREQKAADAIAKAKESSDEESDGDSKGDAKKTKD